ncbi:MAG: hypothetical protein C5B51_23780 [Terriglobia bacterium]|nr:MAG: hypothetical protein C5B51_23780 [Terriglobia bacterium]
MPKRSASLEDPDMMGDQSEESTVERVKSAVSDTAENAKSKVEVLGRTVQGKIDENREPAAQKLQDVASTLHQKADSLPGGEKVASLAHGAADKVQATAEYIREHDVQDMAAGVENFVRRHPGQSLVAAVAIGFLLGRAFKSDD